MKRQACDCEQVCILFILFSEIQDYKTKLFSSNPKIFYIFSIQPTTHLGKNHLQKEPQFLL